MDEHEQDLEVELSHEQEAVMALGLALDEGIEYIRDLLDTLYSIYPRIILKHTPLIMQAESFVREWSPEDDR